MILHHYKENVILYIFLVFNMPPYYIFLCRHLWMHPQTLLRVADKGVLVTTPTLVARTCSQQLLEGNGAPPTLSALPSVDGAVDEGAPTLCS